MKDKLVNKALFNGDTTIIELGYGIYKIIQIRNYDLFVKFIDNCEEKDAEKYVNCPDKNIRKYIARKGFCLDKLINDENSEVCEEVAENGYGLDILINDKDKIVRFCVKSKLYDSNLNIKEYTKNKEYWYKKVSEK